MKFKNVIFKCVIVYLAIYSQYTFSNEPFLADIHVFSIGQADSLLIKTQTKTMLIDMGEPVKGDKNNYLKVAERLDTLLEGKKWIDYFVVSHYHTDHVGVNNNGIDGLIRKSGFKIGQVIHSGSEFDSLFKRRSTYKKFQNNLSSWLNSKLVNSEKVAKLGDIIDLGNGMEVEIVVTSGRYSTTQPSALEYVNDKNPQQYKKSPPSENDLSVGLIFRAGEFEFFTAGDLTGDNEEAGYGDDFTNREFGGGKSQTYTNVEGLMAKYYNENNLSLDIEIYRANHHGSHNSNLPAFVEMLDPEFILYSTGGEYGHPTERVVKLGYTTAKQYVTSKISDETLSNNDLDALNTSVIGEVKIRVYSNNLYSINGALHKAYTSEEEIKNLDADEESKNYLLK